MEQLRPDLTKTLVDPASNVQDPEQRGSFPKVTHSASRKETLKYFKRKYDADMVVVHRLEEVPKGPNGNASPPKVAKVDAPKVTTPETFQPATPARPLSGPYFAGDLGSPAGSPPKTVVLKEDVEMGNGNLVLYYSLDTTSVDVSFPFVPESKQSILVHGLEVGSVEEKVVQRGTSFAMIASVMMNAVLCVGIVPNALLCELTLDD